MYVTNENKRAVVVKEDDILTKKEILASSKLVAEATLQEILVWIRNGCFKCVELRHAKNIMTSRYVCKWKWVKASDGSWKKIIRMRLALRGFMDTEAFSLDNFAGTAKRISQKLLASEAACNQDFILA